FKSGAFTHTGAATRPSTDSEKACLQSMIDDMYVQFVAAVASGRRLDIQDIRARADGRVFTGRGAKERKLIDEIGNFQDAVDLTARLAGLSGKPHLIQVGRQRVTLLDVLTSDLSRILPFQGKSLKSEIRFQYLWK